MKILVIEPNKEPYTKKVNNIDKALIEILGDNLKYIKLKKHIDLVYDDESKLNNLDFNRIIKDNVICGIFAIIAQYQDEWNSLSSKQIRYYKKRFQLRHCRGLLQFMKENIKHSSNLLNLRLDGIEKLNKIIVTDKEMKKLYYGKQNKRNTKRRRNDTIYTSKNE